MSIGKSDVIAALAPPLPSDVVSQLVEEYVTIKQHLAFRRFQPSEMNGGRFAECVVRILQFAHTTTYTPLGTTMGAGIADRLCGQIATNSSLPHTLRTLVPRMAWALYEVRNHRNVGHVGGDVNSNLADSMMVARTADWILTELLRVYYHCDIVAAQKMADDLNEVQVPIVAEVDGFVRIQNTSLEYDDKTLVILYHKFPSKVSDTSLFKWTGYSSLSHYRKNVLAKLHGRAMIHFHAGESLLLPKGVAYVEKNIPMELVVSYRSSLPHSPQYCSFPWKDASLLTCHPDRDQVCLP